MQYNFKNLVFEGGGVKGIAYGGALFELEKMNLLSNVQRVAGTSAGAITAALFALGFTPDDISKIISNTDFKKFEDNTFFVIRDVIRLIKKLGWNPGNVFSEWIGELIRQKTGNKDSTFANLKKTPYFKDLYVICTNVSKQRAEVLSFETTPNLPIREAIRMSMGIPIYFTAVKNVDGDIIVDGGVTLNYPITVFDDVKYISNPNNGMKTSYNTNDEYAFNYETLGFRVDSIKDVNYLKPGWEIEPEPVKGLKSYVGALINFMMEMANKKHLHNDDWNRTIFIDSLDVKTTDFKLSDDKINALISNGQKAVNDYFLWKDNDNKWSNFPK